MAIRIQKTADDTVLEITETVTSKRRVSEKALQQRKAALSIAIARMQGEVDDIDRQLTELYAERDKAK